MRWTIEGADSATGNETRITIEAITESEAEAQARYNGVLVSRIYPAGTRGDGEPVPVVSYAEPSTPAPSLKDQPLPVLPIDALSVSPANQYASVPKGTQSTGIPSYPDIVSGADALKGMASFVRLLGLACIAVSAVVFILPVINASAGRPFGGAEIAAGLASAITPTALGVLMIIMSAVLRMMAAVAVAIRDMARNSFR